jgi:MFS family permease
LSPTFRSLSNRNYRLYASGAVVSNVGTWMQRVAQDWLVLQLTGNSGTALGITTGLQFLPILLLSPYAGLIADRFPKRRLLQVTQLMLAVPALLLGVLAVTGVAQSWHVYVLAFIFGIGSAFDAPARQSFVSEIVGPDDLTNAVGLNSASFNLARMVGPALAGVLIAALGSGVPATGAVILVNAISYGAVILSLQRMRDHELDPAVPVERHKGMIRDGVRYVLARPDLMLILTIVFFAGTFGLNFQLTSALMATEVFDKGASEYGLLGTTLAIGSLSGALLAARRVRIRHRLVILAAICFGVTEIVAGVLPSYLLFALWTPVIGLASLTMITAANATFQMSVAPEMRGRVMALYMMIFMGGTPLGAPVVGWVGETFGARWTLIGGGIATILGTLLAVLVFSRAKGLIGSARTDRHTDVPADARVCSEGEARPAPWPPAARSPRRFSPSRRTRGCAGRGSARRAWPTPSTGVLRPAWPPSHPSGRTPRRRRPRSR